MKISLRSAVWLRMPVYVSILSSLAGNSPCLTAAGPSMGYLVLAWPAWAQEEALACCDCRLLDGRLFSMDVPRSATKAQLCHLAGIVDLASVSLFAYGDPFPLGDAGEVEYVSAGTLLFLPSAARPTPVRSLEQLLEAPGAWADSPLYPSGPEGLHFCCVLDGAARCITIPQMSEASVVLAAARAFWFDVEAFGFQLPQPRVLDAAVRRYLCQDVRILHMCGMHVKPVGTRRCAS